MTLIVFRADSSYDLGMGHLMRCLTLANQFSEMGATCHFACATVAGHQSDRVVQAGHVLHMVETATPIGALVSAIQPDILVLDHYGLDAEWERASRRGVPISVAIDDLADRPHDCSILIDQNLGRLGTDYDGLVPETTLRLIGPDYALIRPEFAQARATSLARRQGGAVSSVLLNFGGADPMGVTAKVLHELSQSGVRDLDFRVVVGSAVPHLSEIHESAKPLGAEVIVDAKNMAQLLVEADLVLGAAGSSAWERCCLGVPSGLVVVADNQRPSAKALERAGAATILADLTNSSCLKDVSGFLAKAMSDTMLMTSMSSKAMQLVDGKGAHRVAERILAAAGAK
ncbi:MAG: UDP-2,4-diacetamido-2,4,6-trideoxy-beta-L-altropyranose hydrolase [Pseudomonadota bacterium]